MNLDDVVGLNVKLFVFRAVNNLEYVPTENCLSIVTPPPYIVTVPFIGVRPILANV